MQNLENNLRNFFDNQSDKGLLCFGSGGDISALCLLTLLYQQGNGMASYHTPLEMASMADSVLRNNKVLILSKSGCNPDCKYMVQRLKRVNPEQLCILTCEVNEKNELQKLAKLPMVSFNVFQWSGENTFLASGTSALFSLFIKVFKQEANFDFGNRILAAYPKEKLEGIDYLTVLYSGYGKAVAEDLNSKLSESVFAGCHISDVRNWTHGQFIGYSQEFQRSALVLLVTPRNKPYFTKLILEGKNRKGERLFPEDLRIFLIETSHDGATGALDLLYKTEHFFEAFAHSKDINPEKPRNPMKIDKRIPRNMPFTPSLMKLGMEGL